MKKSISLVISTLVLFAPLTATEVARASTISHVVEIKAGQFCKKADIGKKKTADNGAKVKCKMDGSRARWKAIN